MARIRQPHSDEAPFEETRTADDRENQVTHADPAGGDPQGARAARPQGEQGASEVRTGAGKVPPGKLKVQVNARFYGNGVEGLNEPGEYVLPEGEAKALLKQGVATLVL